METREDGSPKGLSPEGLERLWQRFDADPVAQQEVIDFKISHLNAATDPNDIAERHQRIQLLQGHVDVDIE